ncbi:MAG: hypothetical protein Q4D76_10215 [Oscillospiraceae bacterium]|nr:hypothetical protein [Oscillospiraceae bacterium]
MDGNVKNKQISDEELENVGGGEIIRIGESMKNQPAGKINYSDYLIYRKKEYVTRTCELCGNKFSAVLEDESHCMRCRNFVG